MSFHVPERYRHRAGRGSEAYATEGALPAPPGWMVGNLPTTERTP